MKVTLNWLKEYVDFDWSPAELAERLTMLGLEVEAIEEVGGEFEGIVVAQVLSKDPHPNADKLSVCRVHDGQGERQIVCGAHNFKPGDKVPLILPGASLPPQPDRPPFLIKVTKIRGVESHGMMCSGKELGLSDDHSGLWILPPDAPVGQPLAEYLGRAGKDVVYDLEITPNRPDLNSVIGIAREIAAATGNLLRLPEVTLPPAQAGPVDQKVAVHIEAPDLCPRYTARLIEGVRVGPSPDWLRHTLEKVGLRSINNVVDATNYVMLETGQPLHAFDYHLIAKSTDDRPTILVRRAREGERFTTLDEQEHLLSSEMLLIADPEKGIALAGVMGGANTEIQDQTRDVLLESAYFTPTQIRRTSKALGLRTDASYRFERGADPGITEYASRRCAQLILQTAGGRLAEGVVDAYPQPVQPRRITLRHRKVNELLGIELGSEQIDGCLERLGLIRVEETSQSDAGPQALAGSSTWEIPTFRVDLKREVDLIEEVCRLHGVDQIPATPPRGALGRHEDDAVHDQLRAVRQWLTGLGLDEAQGQTLIDRTAAERLVPAEQIVPLERPLSSEMDVLRPSLLPGLLDILRHNLSHKNLEVALFEIGRVFRMQEGRPAEQRRVAVALTGRRAPSFWSGTDREACFDIYDLKGLLEEFFDHAGLAGVIWQRRSEPTPLFCESAEIRLGGKLYLGQLGQLLPSLQRRYDLRDPVYLAELDLDLLLARRRPTRTFQPLPSYPSSRRDVAMFVPETVTHADVVAAVQSAKPKYLESLKLFDVFRGCNVPKGQKSLAYAFTYRSRERTLTDDEVNRIHERVVTRLREQLGATIRDA